MECNCRPCHTLSTMVSRPSVVELYCPPPVTDCLPCFSKSCREKAALLASFSFSFLQAVVCCGQNATVDVYSLPFNCDLFLVNTLTLGFLFWGIYCPLLSHFELREWVEFYFQSLQARAAGRPGLCFSCVSVQLCPPKEVRLQPEQNFDPPKKCIHPLFHCKIFFFLLAMSEI